MGRLSYVSSPCQENSAQYLFVFLFSLLSHTHIHTHTRTSILPTGHYISQLSKRGPLFLFFFFFFFKLKQSRKVSFKVFYHNIT